MNSQGIDGAVWETILELAAEGGRITLRGKRVGAGWIFERNLRDHTPELVDEPAIRHSSVHVTGWSAALELLEQYPWLMLRPKVVHEEFRRAFLEIALQRLGSGSSHDRSQLGHWREACEPAPRSDQGSTAGATTDKAPISYDRLDKLGRVRLSTHFFMRDFLYSEIAALYGIVNVPDDADLAIHAGRRLCEELLEPLNATFGRIAIRSAFRSCRVNELGNRKKLNCASNEANYAHHIWDRRDAEGFAGATACIVVPWFMDRFAVDGDWRPLAYWIHDHLSYSEMEFFDGKGMCSFNLTWSENPKKTITSWMDPRVLLKNAHEERGFQQHYQGFPALVRPPSGPRHPERAHRR